MFEADIQMLILVVIYMVFLDAFTALLYYKRRQLRKKHLGKTPLFHCFDVNPRIHLSNSRHERMSIMPIWKVFRK